ncbi:MAG: hypothetical protein VX910_12775 [Candidatus Latescibacterota bacterium]|nr:hypothetical protein [Candidatus Latescibacterota bacterium]
MNIDRMLALDRRIVYVVLLVGVTLALLTDFKLPVVPTRNVRAVHSGVEALQKGQTILISFDFGPSTVTELGPMARAILHHCFRRELRVIAVTLVAEGQGITQNFLEEVAAEYGAEYGKDYVFLGYKAGNEAVILNMGQDMRRAFDRDVRGNTLESMVITQPIMSLRDIPYVIGLSAGYPGVEEWIQFGQERYGFKLGAGVTAVMAPDFFPFLQSGQLSGLLGGLTGAAEYEHLIDREDQAVSGMRPQSVGHVIIIGFILFGNLAYFLGRNRT